MLWIPALPLLAALAGVLIAPRFRHQPERLAALCLQLGIGGPLLALFMTLSATGGLFTASAPGRLSETVTTWLSVGATTTLHLNLSLDYLAATCIAVLFVLTLCTQFAVAGRPQQLLRISAALGAALLLLLGESLLVIALGWHLLGVISLLPGRRLSPARLRAFTLGDAALWAAFAGLTYAAGAPNFGQIHRTALQGPGSRLAQLDLYGLPLAPCIALALAFALLLRLLASPPTPGGTANPPAHVPSPQNGAATQNESFLVLISGAMVPIVGVYLLLRFSSVLAIDTTALSLLSVLGAGLALIATARALACTSAQAALSWVGRAQFGLVLVGVGVRAWVPALVLAWIIAASQCGLHIAASSRPQGDDHRPWARLGAALNALATSAATPIGALPPIALIAAAAWALQGASALAAPGIVIISGLLASVIARSQQKSPKNAATRPPDEPQIAVATVSLGLLGLGLGVLCLPMLSQGLAMSGDLAQNPWATLLRPALRLGQVLAPAAPIDAAVLSALTALVLLAAWLGTAIGRRIPAQTARRQLPAALEDARDTRDTLWRTLRTAPGGLVLGFEELQSRLCRRIYLRLWLAQGRPRPQVLLALIVGIATTLGVIYCNPSVVVIGPTAVHAIDLGGINPLIKAPKRKRNAESPLHTRSISSSDLPRSANPTGPSSLPPPAPGSTGSVKPATPTPTQPSLPPGSGEPIAPAGSTGSASAIKTNLRPESREPVKTIGKKTSR